MKYRLNDLVKTRQNVTLYRSNGTKPRKAVFLRMEPGFFYDQYTDDPVFVESLRNWKITVARTEATEQELTKRGIPFQKKKGCPCTGGVKLVFPGIEVVE